MQIIDGICGKRAAACASVFPFFLEHVSQLRGACRTLRKGLPGTGFDMQKHM
jgi:hypothetical protein